MSEFETKYNEQNNKIEELKSQIALKDQTIAGLMTKCDDNQQYSRRSCLRIHGTETKTKESNEDIIEKVKECYEALEIPFNEANIDRAHRIGEYSDKTTGKKVKSILLNLNHGNLVNNFITLDHDLIKIGRRNQVKTLLYLLI